jgi:serine/threonine protein kinase
MRCPKCGEPAPKGMDFCPQDGTPIPIPEALVKPGLKIGEYIVESKLGAGGMGEVWRASHPIIGKRVAIKILSDDLITNPQSILRFTQEARSVNQIGHRNLIDIFAFGELADGRPYFVMEFLEGKPLADYLSEKKILPFAEILIIFEQLCEALQAAHERQIIHRDLKPDNIFLRFEPRRIFVKVLDFGIAKLAQGGGSWGAGLTRTGAIFGTPHYMSPEQCEAKEIDQRSDIYSLGIILFEMITGRLPFGEEKTPGPVIMAHHIITQAPKPSQMLKTRTIPGSVDIFLARLLAKNPEARPQSCEELYNELVTAVGDLEKERSVILIESTSPKAEAPTLELHQSKFRSALTTAEENSTLPPPQITVSKRKNVLLVDDEPTQLLFQRLLLTSDEIRILEAKSGTEALFMAAQHRPALIVIDFKMPAMDGLETAAKLRAQGDVPILLTIEPVEASYVQQRAEELKLKIITKPLNQVEFFQKVRSLL